MRARPAMHRFTCHSPMYFRATRPMRATRTPMATIWRCAMRAESSTHRSAGKWSFPCCRTKPSVRRHNQSPNGSDRASWAVPAMKCSQAPQVAKASPAATGWIGSTPAPETTYSSAGPATICSSAAQDSINRAPIRLRSAAASSPVTSRSTSARSSCTLARRAASTLNPSVPLIHMALGTLTNSSSLTAAGLLTKR